MSAKKWLDKKEWPDMPIDSDAYSHYTNLSTLLEQFAKEYHEEQLVKWAKIERTRFNKFL